MHCLLLDLNVFFRPDLDMKLTFLPLKRLLHGQEALRNFDGRILHPEIGCEKNEKTVRL
jgi:hypothetical protein